MVETMDRIIGRLDRLSTPINRTDYSLVPDAYNNWMSSRPDIVRGEYSYQTLPDGKVITASGEEPHRAAERERDHLHHYLGWTERTFPQYGKLINTIVTEPRSDRWGKGIAGASDLGRRDMAPMDANCQYSVFIPARNEEQVIKKTLMMYAEQVGSDGKPLDPSTWEINVLVNCREDETPDKTYEQVMEFKREYPHIRCNVIELKLEKPWAQAGFARKLISDITMARGVQRKDKYTKPLYLESQDADLLKVDPRQVDKSLRLLESRPELDAVAGHTEMMPTEMAQNDLVFLSRRFWDFARVQTNRLIHKVAPERRNFDSTRVWTFGTSTAINVESLALIGGYNWDARVGEDLDIGKRLSILRGKAVRGRFVPNVGTVAESGTRTNSSPRRYYWGTFNTAGSEYDNFDDQTVRKMSLAELQRNAPYGRITKDNVKRFEKMFYHAYESLRFMLPDPDLSRQVMHRTLFYLGFKPEDFEIVGNKVRIIQVDHVADALANNRRRLTAKEKIKKGEPKVEKSVEQLYQEDREKRRALSERLIAAGTPMEEILRQFGNDYTAMENYYRKVTGTELVRDPVRSLEVDTPITKSMSIVIPVYNKSEDLIHTLKAIEISSFAQKYPGQLEVIIVDDGSPQKDIIQWAQRAGAHKLNYKVVRIPNSAKVGAMYTGIEMAKGDFVMTIDSDYVPLPQTIEEMMKRHEVCDNAVLLGFRSDIERDELTQKGVETVITGTQPRFVEDVRFIGDNNFADTKWFKTAGFDRPIYDGHTRMRMSSFSHEVVRSAPREALLKAMGGYTPGATVNPGDEILCHRLQAQGLYVVPVTSAVGFHIAHTSNHNPERSRQRRTLMRELAKQPFPAQSENPYRSQAQILINHQVEAGSPILHTPLRDKKMRAVEAGSMYIDADLSVQAVPYLEKAVEVDPSSPRAHALLAVARLNTGDIPAAKNALTDAIQRSSKHPYVMAAQGALLAHSGDFEQARTYLYAASQSGDEQAVRLATRYIPNDKDQVNEAARYMEEAKEQPLRKNRAIQALRRALIGNPRHREAARLLQTLAPKTA